MLIFREASQKKNSLNSELGQIRGGRGPAKPKLNKILQFGTFGKREGGLENGSKLKSCKFIKDSCNLIAN